MADRPTYVWSGSEWDAVADPGAVRKALVNAKGDLVTATANDTPAILTAGSNGQMLMADSAATAGLRYVDPPANRNLIINGAMQVAQRNTSVASITGSGYFTADRWYMENSLGTWMQSVENDAPTGSGFRKSLKMLCTTANASPSSGAYCLMRQLLEGQDVQRIAKGTSDAKPLTLSFWVKSNVTGTFIVDIEDQDNARAISQAYTVSSSGTWEKKQIEIPADTTGAFNNDNGASLLVTFWLAAGSSYTGSPLPTTWGARQGSKAANGQTNLAAATNNYWQITGVQLETGPVATPFEFEPYEATLRKCQRYYYKANMEESAYPRFGLGFATTTSSTQIIVPVPVPMRAAPSAITTGGTVGVLDATTITNTTAVTINTGGTKLQTLNADVSGTPLTANRPYQLIGNNNTATFIAFSAEL